MQWLVFRRDGSETAAAWAQKAAEATASNTSIGDGEFMDFFEPLTAAASLCVQHSATDNAGAHAGPTIVYVL